MKRVYLNLRIALRSLYNFKLRTILAVLGVFLGTFSLILVSNLSGSLAEKTRTEIQNFGESLLIVQSGVVRSFGARTRLLSQATNLTLADSQAILDSSKFVREVSSSVNQTFPVRFKKTVLSSILVVGVERNYAMLRNFKPIGGRFIEKADNRYLRKVAIIGNRVVETLFKDRNPIGKYILIRRVPCQVIGVMEEKGADISGADQDNQIFIPLTTFMRRLTHQDHIDTIYVHVMDENVVSLAKSEIESLLRQRHNIKKGEDDDFTVIDVKEVLALKAQTTRMITLLGRTSAVISFLIGGIGILSIMIFIIHERKTEIGIRRAVGSRKRDIVFQFLLESSFISFAGGTVGVVFGLAASLIVFWISGLPFKTSMAGFIFSFIASATVGILAGIYPAQKATTIQPVDILTTQ